VKPLLDFNGRRLALGESLLLLANKPLFPEKTISDTDMVFTTTSSIGPFQLTEKKVALRETTATVF
jgi:hypothetical protein